MSIELIKKEKEVELKKKFVELNEMTRKETVQTVKEKDLIVPDGKPDMKDVMYLDGQMAIEQMEVQDDRVVYKGQVEVTILYTCENNPEKNHVMKAVLPVEDFIRMDGVGEGHKVKLDYHIEHINWHIVNERKISIKAIIEMTVCATKPKETTMTTGVEGLIGTQTQTKTMEIIQPARAGDDQMTIKDDLTIMQGKDAVGEMVKMTAKIKEEQVKRTDTEMMYNGMVEVTTLYKGQEEGEKMEVVTHRIPFNGAVDVVKDDEEMYWDFDLDVTPTYANVQPDYDGEDRVVEVECVITCKYNTYNKLAEEVVDDIYCPGKKVDKTCAEEMYMNMVYRSQTKSPKKEMITFDEMAPNADRIFDVSLRPMIEQKEMGHDKVTLRGMMQVKITYLRDGDMQMMEVMEDMIPFVQDIAVPGAMKGDYIDVKVKTKNANISGFNKSDMMMEYEFDCIVDVYREEVMNTITDVEVDDIDKEEMNNVPSITVYVVKKGDTLWNIAKRFNTTVKDIEEVNELENASMLYPGQKLIIIKKTKF